MEVEMNRDTPNIYDLIFKKLLRISKKALICLINAQFHTTCPLNSSVEYLSTEHISKYLGHLFSDSLIKIAGKHLYHFEAEIRYRPEMILRLYVYGFEIGMERKEVKSGKIIIRFPQVKVFYWEPNSRTPAFVASTSDPISSRISPASAFRSFALRAFSAAFRSFSRWNGSSSTSFCSTSSAILCSSGL
jgi:hypothetical protein